MSKLSSNDKFLDVSDYGRPIAVAAVQKLKHTSATPVQVTFVFGLCGLTAAYCIIQGYYVMAGVFLILKSIIDAMDGELARVKKSPSYTGRYLDSVFDYLLNFIILMSVWYVSDNPFWSALLAFFCLQLQGTLYNYYYVILRHQSANGDKTSNIFEEYAPKAYPQEKQAMVNRLFKIYRLFYSFYDKLIYRLDRDAATSQIFPGWFMSMLSIYGLGFQLLIMAVMLSLGLVNYIFVFFISYTLFALLFISIRRTFLTEKKGK